MTTATITAQCRHSEADSAFCPHCGYQLQPFGDPLAALIRYLTARSTAAAKTVQSAIDQQKHKVVLGRAEATHRKWAAWLKAVTDLVTPEPTP